MLNVENFFDLFVANSIYFCIFAKNRQNNFVKMKSLGYTLRELRRNKALPLRTIAAYLDIDQAILSRIERGQRKATREQVVKLAEYFNVDENDLLIAWLSDKVVYEVADEHIALQALRVAEEKVKYNTIQKV
jgi:transcriptional regulator with XRE-family HTH domain